MQARTYWRTVTVDQDFLDRVLEMLDTRQVRFCVIGGVAVNAYVEPLVSLDLDLVVAFNALANIEAVLRGTVPFTVEAFPHSLNISASNSDLRVQFQLDLRYQAFLDRAKPQPVLGLVLPVAAIEDVLQGKCWAAEDRTRRASKRSKDLTDVTRLLEAYPDLRARVPTTILARLFPWDVTW
jgi:hypothetical protein